MDERLTDTLKAFHTITGCRIAIFDEWNNEIAAYPRPICALCERLRQNGDIDAQCRECDKQAFLRTKDADGAEIYLCHMGLYECVSPIRTREGVFLGTIMIGQMRTKDTSDIIREKAAHYLPLSMLETLLPSATLLRRDVLKAGAHIMSVCAEYLCLSESIHQKRPLLVQRLTQIIEENLSRKLTVKDMAEHFGISETTLYQLTKKHFNLAPMQYVNTLRAQRARELIAQGMRLAQIGVQVGIPDENYLGRVLRRTFGKSYRKLKEERNL